MRSIQLKLRNFITDAAFMFSILAVAVAGAHGENKPGPNGGAIRMPGPYHTETVQRSNGFQIFLLDINFENPTVLASDVRAALRVSDTVTPLRCEAQNDHFFCVVPVQAEAGTLIIDSKRKSIQGNEIQYDLPL